MHVVPGPGQGLGDIQGGVRLFVEMQAHPLGKGRGLQALDEGRALGRTSAVVQLEIRAAVGQLFGHAEERGNADAAGEQQAAPCCVLQGKEIAWLADAQARAHLQLLVQAAGATAGGRVLSTPIR